MYINRAVCGFIEHDGKFLVVTRRNSKDWGLVGGKVDPGETEEQALIREVFEETNLKVTKFLPLYSGVCGAGEDGKAFFTTTYLVYEVQSIHDCVPMEDGITPLWKNLEDFNTDTRNKFKEYNNLVIQNYQSIKDNLDTLTA